MKMTLEANVYTKETHYLSRWRIELIKLSLRLPQRGNLLVDEQDEKNENNKWK